MSSEDRIHIATGTRLVLRNEATGAIRPALVVQVKAGLVWISNATDPGDDGELILMEHSIPGDALYRARARVEFVPPETYALRRVGEWERIQRRGDVRISTGSVEIQLDVQAGRLSGERGLGKLIDLSAGGLSARVSTPVEIGAVAICSFELQGESFDLEAEVVRMSEARSGREVEVGLRFSRLMQDEREALIRWVFREQLRRRTREGAA